MNPKPFGSKFRMCRSAMRPDPIARDIHDPAVLSSYACTHQTMTADEVEALIARAEARQREGHIYVPCDAEPGHRRYAKLL